MDEVLNGKTAPEQQDSNTNAETVLGSEYDLNLDDLVDESKEDNNQNSTPAETSSNDAKASNDTDDVDDEDDGSEEVDFSLDGDRSNTAFASMRTENKKYKDMISDVESLAKSLGFADANAFITKAKQRVADKQAQQSGVSAKVYEEIQNLSKNVNDIMEKMTQQEVKQRGKELASTLQEFISDNKLSKPEVDKLSKDLSKDGITDAMLFNMPKAALTHLLGSYIDKKQETINKKEQIRKEMPISQSSNNKVDINKLNKDIDNLAKMLAGKK
jgi:hypothetical protein